MINRQDVISIGGIIQDGLISNVFRAPKPLRAIEIARTTINVKYIDIDFHGVII